MTTLICSKTQGAITLTQCLAKSGEGEVWQTNWHGMLAKIYHEPTQSRMEKLAVMVTYPPKDPNQLRGHVSYAWPQSVLQRGGQPVGFLMPAITGGKDLLKVYSPLLRKRLHLEVDWRFLHVTSLNVVSLVERLHQEGYVLGDIKPQNILVNNQALPSIIDVDSFQVCHPSTRKVFHCPVGTEGFTPPELLGEDLASFTQIPEHDNFRVAVLVYWLLLGQSPWAGDWRGKGEPPAPSDKLRQGLWTYGTDALLKPGKTMVPLESVHPRLQSLFLQCFNDGHRNPARRPTVSMWHEALQEAVADLQSCEHKAGHIYSQHHSQCIWCKRAATLGVDIFDGPMFVRRHPATIEAVSASPKASTFTASKSVAAPKTATPKLGRRKLLGWIAAGSSGLFVSELARRIGMSNVPIPDDTLMQNESCALMFRGNPARTGNYCNGLTGEVPSMAWQFATEGTVRSSVAANNDLVYISSSDSYLYALDKTTGQKVWSFLTASEILSSPAIWNGIIYSGSWDNHLYAIDAETGREIWRFRTAGEITSSPAVLDGVVYIGNWDKHLYALDASTGREIWRFRFGGEILSSPAILDGIVYVGSWNNFLHALDAITGTEIWRFRAGGNIVSSPMTTNGVVYIGSLDSYLYAVDLATGSELWKFKTEGGIISSPASANGVIYIGSRDNHLYAVDSIYGRELWKFKTEDHVDSSPAFSDGIIYVGSMDGNLYSIDASTGQELWRLRTNDGITASPTIADGVVYIGSWDKYLYALR
ncbi:MAG: hypothetical protein EA367_01340 [Leptolyngbya sp. DLM2.Bin15]|nr:MAG: hypothetical protein EA367_01340 [Leptolyngbya sp. DLM2.Bin15]